MFIILCLIVILQSCLVMDPDKRLTCGQLLQHQYFDGFNNEFDRERKERQKQLDREQQKLLQQQAKLQNNVYVSNTKQQNPGVSLLKYNKNEFFLYENIFPFDILLEPVGSGSKNLGPDGLYILYRLTGISPLAKLRNSSIYSMFCTFLLFRKLCQV